MNDDGLPIVNKDEGNDFGDDEINRINTTMEFQKTATIPE